MRLKNYQEDIVLSAIQLYMEGQHLDLLNDTNAINDIAAYVLNRITPRYIMSERGFIRLTAEQETERSMADMIMIMILIGEAVELLQKRRPPSRLASVGNRLNEEEPWLPVHNFPHIIGKVIDGKTGKSIGKAEISLFVDDTLSESAMPGWSNPFTTNSETQGYFSFWPRYRRIADEETTHDIRLTISHPDYRDYTLTDELKSFYSHTVNDSISLEHIVNLQAIRLEQR